MERLRAQLGESALQPVNPKALGSTKHRPLTILSSDEENSDDEGSSSQRSPPRLTASGGNIKISSNSSKFTPPQPQPKPKAMAVPQYTTPSPGPSQDSGEAIDLAGIVANPYEITQSATETQKHLMDLVQSGSNDYNEDVDMALAVVEGFNPKFKLKAHQVIGRKWMAERESGKKSGGILGDDMGLGKTIQTLNLIADFKHRDDERKDEILQKFSRTTLVVCPPAVLPQWVKEIERIAPCLSVKQHHGTSRTTDAKQFRKFDVVVTSYQTLSSEHKNRLENTAGSKDDESDPDSDDSGIGRALAARSKKAKAGKKSSTKPAALFDMKWLRVVLDEAHTIKNKTTAGAKACFDLTAKFRWCLTGTPIQNNVDELFPLLRFLGIRPLNDWDTFSSQISKPIKAGRSGVPMKRLQVVLSAIMLRRLKTQTFNGQPILDLPDRNVEVVECEFDKDEEEFYTALVERTDDKLQHLEKNASMMSVLLLLLRLRQACCHVELCMKKVKDDLEAIDPKAAKKESGAESLNDDADDLADLMGGLAVKESTCEICQEVLPMRHKSQYCADCELEIVTKAKKRQSLSTSDGPLGVVASAKIRELLKILDDIEKKSEGERKDKTLVFSQFTSFLDIIEKFLRHKNIKFERYDGKMKMDERSEALERFQKSKTCNVLLISFKAGSTGLNLTAANHVVLMDLWWNPSLEDQAFDRAHRFGQTKDVFIRKLVIPKTVEERIQALQDKKRELATNALTGAKLGKGKGLRMDELLALFSHDLH